MGIKEERVGLLDDPEEILRTKWDSRHRPICAISITILSLLVNVALIAALLIIFAQHHQCLDPSLQLVFCECP